MANLIIEVLVQIDGVTVHLADTSRVLTELGFQPVKAEKIQVTELDVKAINETYQTNVSKGFIINVDGRVIYEQNILKVFCSANN
jgi:hypothetical protein